VQLDYPRTRVCDVLDAPRSTIYAREGAARRAETGVVIAFPKRGPRTELPDDELLVLIRRVIQETPFSGERSPQGHRPHHLVVGEVADRDAVLTLSSGRSGRRGRQTAGHDASRLLRGIKRPRHCPGRMRRKNVQGPAEMRVERVMESGPATVRPGEPAKALLERMKRRNVPAMIVTTERDGSWAWQLKAPWSD